jgi:hypothetical protein
VRGVPERLPEPGTESRIIRPALAPAAVLLRLSTWTVGVLVVPAVMPASCACTSGRKNLSVLGKR